MKHNRKIIYLAGFLISVPIALTSYINSSLLEIYVDKYFLGIIYMLASLITIIGMAKMPKILTRLGNRKSTLLFCLIFLASLILMGLGGKGFIVIPAFIFYFVSVNLIFATLDIFIEDFSKNSPVGGIPGVYLLSALFVSLVCIIFSLFLRDFKDPQYEKVPILRTIIFFWRNRNIAKIYLITLILRFFYAWMIIYTPIYMHEYIGFDWSQIGIIFSIMLLPFIILELPLGILSDRIGEKKMLIVGFCIISVSTAMIPLFSIPVLLIVPSFEYLFFVLGAVMLCGLLISLRLRDVR